VANLLATKQYLEMFIKQRYSLLFIIPLTVSKTISESFSGDCLMLGKMFHILWAGMGLSHYGVFHIVFLFSRYYVEFSVLVVDPVVTHVIYMLFS